jgi:hypothetical protein
MALKIFGIVVGGVAAVLVAMSAPDIARYLKIRSM